jgi:hypothetical protein
MYTSPKDLNTYSEEAENKQNAKETIILVVSK